MAVDTRNKRASCLGIGHITRSVLPDPDGTVGQEDRQQCAYSYSGLQAGLPAETVTRLVTAIDVYGQTGNATPYGTRGRVDPDTLFGQTGKVSGLYGEQ